MKEIIDKHDLIDIKNCSAGDNVMRIKTSHRLEEEIAE